MTQLRKGIGRLLRRERTRVGFSQRKLARAAAVDVSCICHIEAGRRTPSVELLYVLAGSLGCLVSDLLPAARAPSTPRGEPDAK